MSVGRRAEQQSRSLRQRTHRPEQCLHSAEVDVRPPRRKVRGLNRRRPGWYPARSKPLTAVADRYAAAWPECSGMSWSIERRGFIMLLAGVAVWPVAARAQQLDRMRRIGVLIASAESDPERQRTSKAFQEALQDRTDRRPKHRDRHSLGPPNRELMQRFARTSSRCSQMLMSLRS